MSQNFDLIFLGTYVRVFVAWRSELSCSILYIQVIRIY